MTRLFIPSSLYLISAVTAFLCLIECQYLFVVVEANNNNDNNHDDNNNEDELLFDKSLLGGEPNDVASYVIEQMYHHSTTKELHGRLSKIFEKTKTVECRELISEHFNKFISAFNEERSLPFSDITFTNECENDDLDGLDFNNLPPGINLGTIQARTYQINDTELYFKSPLDIRLCYGILAHDNAQATIRLIEALNDSPKTTFIVHVDGKYDETYQILKQYSMNNNATTKPTNVHVLDNQYRVRVNWGGFSMVNATLQMINYLDKHITQDYTHFVHLAATCYPIASNRRIRNTLASYPIDTNFMHVILKPTKPGKSIWNYFVECDDTLHRIYQLQPLSKEISGVNQYTSSQWFIISKEFTTYLANPTEGTFLYDFLQYIPHTVVADETFFGTVLRNTPFCHKHHNWNFLHLQFDQWENERSIELRDERKCVMPDPNHCGRSPTTITLDYLDILELSEDLFARKFLDDVDPKVKNVIDTMRTKEEFVLTSLNVTEPTMDGKSKVDLSFVGHGVLFVAKSTIEDTIPLCLGLGETQNKVRLIPCFQDWVPKTLAPEWETGAVVLEETIPHNRWEIGPCSSDGNLERLESGQINVTSGFFTPTGPRCTVRMMDGLREGRCLDGESLDPQPGGLVHVYPCTKRWHQFVSFGNGREVPFGSIHTTVPLHTRRRIAETGREQEAYMCLGVAGRGDKDEEDWLGQREEEDSSEDDDNGSSDDNGDEDNNTEDPVDEDTFSVDNDETPDEDDNFDPDGLPALRGWIGEQIVATRCSNVGAVIEWVVVPFIVEDEPEHDENQNVSLTKDGEEEEEEL